MYWAVLAGPGGGPAECPGWEKIRDCPVPVSARSSQLSNREHQSTTPQHRDQSEGASAKTYLRKGSSCSCSRRYQRGRRRHRQRHMRRHPCQSMRHTSSVRARDMPEQKEAQEVTCF